MLEDILENHGAMPGDVDVGLILAAKPSPRGIGWL